MVFCMLRRAGSSPQVVLLTDFVPETDQKTPEHGSSQRRSPSEVPESQSHEPGTPGKHQAHHALQAVSDHCMPSSQPCRTPHSHSGWPFFRSHMSQFWYCRKRP